MEIRTFTSIQASVFLIICSICWLSMAVFGLAVKAVGDTYVDAHHTVEDIALTLGLALTQALGDKAGIERYGDALGAYG